MKIKRILICATFLIVSISSIAGKQLVEGYYVTYNNDTVYGKFEIRDLENRKNFLILHERAIFVTDEEVKREIDPYSVNEYSFIYGLIRYVFISCKWENILGRQGRSFFIREIDGYIKKYYYYLCHGSVGNYSVFRVSCYQKGNDCIRGIRRQKKKILKDMEYFIGDNPSILSEIDSKKPHKTDIDQLIIKYNNWHSKKMEE